MTEVSLDIQEVDLGDVDIGSSSKKEVSLNLNDDLKASNFGSGIELLMNDKVKNSSGKSSSKKDEGLSSIEKELDNIDNVELTGDTKEKLK